LEIKMAKFAIHNGVRVVNVIVAETQELAEELTKMSAVETDGEPWTGWRLVEGKWVRPAPHPSWSFDIDAWEWQAPIPHPTDGKDYQWDEDAGDWVEVEAEVE
jgi:hypothetical protein